ncbi:uncharacterized protein LOC108277487 isoform X3 [Ictalurus punctatus]|uniref:Uncharacterized protein LOC108277487 isoform X3 n=1 Tax=Ictalurus punctatus TaxID=7998 RepID=A0A2D0STZ5_ICTPU|nr:uncharacterized protein LOC108277487 isoform X3 [Ictalurus punctatus]
MSQYELFYSQTMSIMTLLTDRARAEIRRVYHDNTDTEKELKLAQLNAIMEFLVKEAARKICLLFKLCSEQKECNVVDLDSASERSGNVQGQPEPKEPATQPENAQTTISGGTVYILVSGKEPPALPRTSTPLQDVLTEDECPDTQELESTTAMSSFLKLEENGKKIQTIFIVKEKILQVILSCNPTTCPLDTISFTVLQTISRDLFSFIATVINDSITSGNVPNAFKKARVVPFLKEPSLDPSDVCKYQPV